MMKKCKILENKSIQLQKINSTIYKVKESKQFFKNTVKSKFNKDKVAKL